MPAANASYVRLDSPERPEIPAPAWPFPPGTPECVLSCDQPDRATLHTPRGVTMQWDDPLDALQWMSTSLAARRRVRWIGFLSYDLGRLFESLPAKAEDDLNLPLFRFTLQCETDKPPDHSPTPAPPAPAGPITSTFDRPAYLRAVERVMEYIRAGDVFQVNLSQRFSVPLKENPALLYARLREQAPARYGACLQYDNFALLCNSPELFLRVEPRPGGRRRVITRPIKGTRPRRPGMESALRDSPKDQAELNMIIDLERNDLGRVCETGSVKVTEPRTIEAHPTVYHGVASIEGDLRDQVTFVDLLRATFPGGSITGAPKIRAMEIIESLEPVRRGPYCGAIGYLAPDGAMEFNIAIRTIVIRNGLAHIQVGGGIVADSTPAAEFDETLVKAEALFRALGVPGRQG